MTQPSRTMESISRDNAAIREIMHQIRELTVPDRATLAVGLIGHLATMMNRSQMAKLLGELQEEAERVQDVPPARQRDIDARSVETEEAFERQRERPGNARGGIAAGEQYTEGHAGDTPAKFGSDERGGRQTRGRTTAERGAGSGVGQAGRGEFRSGELL